MGGYSTSAERAEAERVGAALILCVLDGDEEGATVLLGNSSHQVLAQTATDLARWITQCVEGDRDEFRAGVRKALGVP
jgi:hypothetical protein